MVLYRNSHCLASAGGVTLEAIHLQLNAPGAHAGLEQMREPTVAAGYDVALACNVEPLAILALYVPALAHSPSSTSYSPASIAMRND
jgi:hypothetical protein